MSHALTSPREVAIDILIWVVVGVAAILMHEERIRFMKRWTEADIYTDKRAIKQRSRLWFFASMGTLFLFYLVGCQVTMVKSLDYILGIDDQKTFADAAGMMLVMLILVSLVVPVCMYLRYCATIKKTVSEQPTED